MRLENLFENHEFDNDIVVFEVGNIAIEARLLGVDADGSLLVEFDEQGRQHFTEATEMLNEFLPLLIGAAGLGMSAYDAYRNYQDYRSGRITGQQLAARVGADAALNMIGGGIAKGAQLAVRGAKRAFQSAARRATGTAGGQAASQAAQAAGVDGAQLATQRAARQADAAATPAARTAARQADDVATSRASRRARRGALGGSTNGGDAGAYNNPMQRAISGFTEAEYQGRDVTLNKPMQGDVKKFKVYVKNEKGNVVKVNFGDPDMRIKKSNPERRKSFRARHKCDTAKDKTSARYWSCRMW
jgi:hypothetical protein